MTIQNFEFQLEKLNDNNKKEELLKLFKNDPNKAYTEYRKALALKIAKENKTLFERLSRL